ncbi:hypothetical protein [Companilactobacillus mishanensis]|uniref:hypothetical protein n=1 Tax=Companilactobacillus mishanensis TaxID=2486008 RepID=UPI000F7A3C16|nr:hypothetical protein [Companilactobacillus mishanensis]
MMKSNKIPILFFIVTLMLSVTFVISYNRINADTRGPVKEVMFSANKLVKAHNINFEILDVKKTNTNDTTEIAVLMHVVRTGNSNFGFKANNNNFIENVWLNIPYSSQVHPEPFPTDELGHRVTFHDIQNKKDMKLILKFQTDKKQLDKSKNARVSFMIPNGKHYTKYSLLIN